MHELVIYYPQGHQAHAELGHPERPERVETIRFALEKAGLWQKFPHLDPVEIPDEVLKSIHQPEYLTDLESICHRGQHYDMDTYTTISSWQLALNAAGGGLACAMAVWNKLAQRAFAMTRPPGHHATSNRAMGFCLLNNISLAAEFLIQQEGAKRLAIIDLDLHHGNGTQEIFYRRGDVFYFSTHQAPLYPGTGLISETGIEQGEWKNANFPLPPLSGDKAFEALIVDLIIPLLDRYEPQMILVSYGFDPHWRDPLGNLLLSAGGYGKLVKHLSDWADENCDGKIALFLEGGYDLEAARACSLSVVSAMLGEKWEDPIGLAPFSEGMGWNKVVDHAKHLWGIPTD